MSGELGKGERPTPNYDVFISHSSVNTDVAQRLADELHARGLNSCFFDYQAAVGQNWQQQIKEAVENSRYCVVILTGNYDIPSPRVSREWASIQECSWRRPEMPICSLTTEDIAPPPFLREWRSIRCKPDASDVRSAADQILVLFWDNLRERHISPTCSNDPEARERFAEIRRALEGFAKGDLEQ